MDIIKHIVRLSKQPKKYGSFSARGYLLPIVIALSLAISTVSVMALQVVSQNGSTLNGQYYNELAREAAQAGAAAATKCIEANTYDWDQGNGKPRLKPETDCNGNSVTGRSTTVITVGNNVESSYEVKGLENPYSNTTRVIVSTGTVKVKNSLGLVLRTFTQTTRTLGKISNIYGYTGKNVSQISTGGGTTCAVAEGSAYCWGANWSGQLGIGTTAYQGLPKQAALGGTVTKVSVGANHVCAVSNGRAYCWGENSSGQLGNGNNSDQWNPTAVNTASAIGARTIVDIEAGQDFTCAMASDASVWCWGYGGEGSLGTGNENSSNVPRWIYRDTWHYETTNIAAGCLWSIVIFCAFPWPPASSGGLWSPPTSLYNKRVTGLGRPAGRTMCVTAVNSSDTTTIANQGYPHCWGKNVPRVNPNTYDVDPPCSANSAPWPFGYENSYQSANEFDTPESYQMQGGVWVTGGLMSGYNSVPSALSGTNLYYWNTGYRRTTVHTYSTGYCVAVILWIPYFFAVMHFQATFATVGGSAVLGGTNIALQAGAVGGSVGCYYVASNLYCDAHGQNVTSGQLGDGVYHATSPPGWYAVKMNGPASLGSQLPITDMDIGYGGTSVCVVASQNAYCWGNGTNGELGNNAWANSQEPVAVDAANPNSDMKTTSVLGASFDNPITF